MPAIIKNELRVLNSDMFINYVTTNPTYLFLSGTTAWSDELRPPTPIDSAGNENYTLNDILGLKRIMDTDVVSVVPRIDWREGIIFDQYDSRVNMIDDRNPETGDYYRYYSMTSDLNVYKCLSNGYGAESTYRPTGTTPEPFQTPDGYIWKYLYTIPTSDAFKFMTVNWMPCYTLTSNDGSAQWNSQQSAVPGTIDRVSVLIKGAGYNPSSPPEIVINGDGDGAQAIAVVNPDTGQLDDVIVTSSGSGYSFADISVVDSIGVGVGAEAVSTVSPRQGNGYDPRVELGATFVMIKMEIDGDEGGTFPTNVDYRSSGILYMPGGSPDGLAIKVSSGDSRLFNVGETIQGSESNAIADITFIDYAEDILYVNNITWTFLQTENISSQSWNATAIDTISSGFMPLTAVLNGAGMLQPGTGRLLYVANREKISRTDNQREDVITVISF